MVVVVAVVITWSLDIFHGYDAAAAAGTWMAVTIERMLMEIYLKNVYFTRKHHSHLGIQRRREK